MKEATTARPVAPTLRFSRDVRTAWTFAYNVYRNGSHLGLVYRGSDEMWHAIANDGVTVRSDTRRMAGRWLHEHVR